MIIRTQYLLFEEIKSLNKDFHPMQTGAIKLKYDEEKNISLIMEFNWWNTEVGPFKAHFYCISNYITSVAQILFLSA